MRRSIVVTTLMFVLFSWTAVTIAQQESDRIYIPGQKVERLHSVKPKADSLPPKKLVPAVTEFHYTGKYCSECHEQIPKRGGERYLKFGGDYNRLCRCHLKTPDSYIHPTDIKPSDEKRTRIPSGFPLEQGKLTCLTCHDLYRQCQKQEFDKISLRGVPYRKTTDFCFQCHDQKNYVQLDPHEQLDKKGNIVTEKCLYCHTEVPDAKKAELEDPKLVGDLEVLCQRCHFHFARQMQTSKFSHMIKPTAKTIATMKKMEKKLGIVLPLDEEGKTTCATCHNPHEKGVIPAESPGATGAGSKHRLRLPEPPCKACHDVAQGLKK